MIALRAFGYLLLVAIVLPPYVASVVLAMPYLVLNPMMSAVTRLGDSIIKSKNKDKK